MSLFPTSPAPSYPIELSQEFKTAVSDFQSGKEQRRQIWSFPKRTIKLQFDALAQADVDTLFAFYSQKKGSLTSFYYLWPLKTAGGDWPSCTGEYVGRGTGAQTIFELPSKSTTGLTVYVNGTPASITFLSGGGDEGVDRIEFSTAPASGTVITADFTGQQRFRVRFQEDMSSKSLFQVVLYNMGLSLQEVRI